MIETTYRLCPECEGKSTYHNQCDTCGFRGIVHIADLEIPDDGDPNGVTVTISVECDADLTYDECFPDKTDEVTPNTVTAAHVIDAMKMSGSKSTALADWGIGELNVVVSVKNSSGEMTFDSW